MNILFLDYDGVVNTPMWDEKGEKCTFNFPSDNKVNNFQCVQWVSEFCQEYDYKIVVTSSWRTSKNYIKCLVNGGLRSGVEVVGKTPSICDGDRSDEILAYLNEHPDIEHFIILDDEPLNSLLKDHLILCNTNTGFGLDSYLKAAATHEGFLQHAQAYLHNVSFERYEVK